MGPLISSRRLPAAVVLVGKDRTQFERLAKRGVRIFAVVGSARLVASARGFGQHHLSFDQSAQADRVRNWEDIIKQLQPEDQAP